MTTPFRNTRIEFHILQSFPVTCLNRDDVGAPSPPSLAVCRAPECHRSAGSARCVWRCLITVFVSGCVVKNCLTAGQRLSRTGSERRTGHRMR